MNENEPSPSGQSNRPEKRHLGGIAWLLPIVALTLPVAAFYWSTLQPGPVKSPLPNEFVADPNRGEVLFSQQCARCHGSKGKGDGPMAAGLPKPPRDLTLGGWTKATDPLKLKESLLTGIDGVHPSFKQQLSNRDIDNLVAYTWLMSKDNKKEKTPAKTPSEKATPDNTTKGTTVGQPK